MLKEQGLVDKTRTQTRTQFYIFLRRIGLFDYEISLVLSGSFFIQSVGNKKLCCLPFPQFISINVGFWISFLSLKVATGGIKRIIWVRSSLLAYLPGRLNEATPVSVSYKDQYSKGEFWEFPIPHFDPKVAIFEGKSRKS